MTHEELREWRASMAQLSIHLSSFDNHILAKCNHDGERWNLDNEPMDSAMLTQIQRLLSKMSRVADNGIYALGMQS